MTQETIWIFSIISDNQIWPHVHIWVKCPFLVGYKFLFEWLTLRLEENIRLWKQNYVSPFFLSWTGNYQDTGEEEGDG
jgi:hypothetical protein